jgi:molybdopterin/thiamine biosynthesis adenylyltransferase
MFQLETVEPQFGRVKGASWFPLLYKKDVMVLGQGGIGSWTALLLSRIGCNLHLFDMDRYEVHNMTGQIVKHTDIGKNKAQAMKDVIAEFSPNCDVTAYQTRYDEECFANDIMICGFDNMAARKAAFQNWKRHISTLPEGIRDGCFFQDGRLLAEQLQIFSISGNDKERMTIYERDWLFDDKEVEEAECTFKQTSHCAAMIASHMVGFLTNWVANVEMVSKGFPPMREVPFMYEYLIPANLVT